MTGWEGVERMEKLRAKSSAVRTAVLIGGPCDAKGMRVSLGQPDLLIPVSRHPLRAALFDLDENLETGVAAFHTELYTLIETAGFPDTELQFYRYVGRLE